MIKYLAVATALCCSYPAYGKDSLSYDDEQASCIQEAIFGEASNQSLKGKFAVYYVINQRAKKTGTTPCQVIKKPYQFSYRNKNQIGQFLRRKLIERRDYDNIREVAEYIYHNPRTLRDTGLNGQDHYMTVNLAKSPDAPYYYTQYGCNKKIIQDHIFFNLCTGKQA